jgi:hypothetical protein
MKSSFIERHRFQIKWISISFCIKLALFLFFQYQFHHNRPPDVQVGPLFIGSGDTSEYYLPIEDFVHGLGYTSFCRMPGLLPVYAPLLFLFGAVWGKTLIILLQFTGSVLSVYLVGRIAALIFKKQLFFYLAFFLYAFSSFVSIWDHLGYSDSFAISLEILSFYYLLHWKEQPLNKWLFLSGFFLAWSLFFRPIQGVLFPCSLLVIFSAYHWNFLKTLRASLLFVFPCLLFIGIWTSYNYSKHARFIPLQGPTAECFPGIPEEHLAIRKLIIAWGGDFQKWSVHSPAEWFFEKNYDYRAKNPFGKEIFCSVYTLDTLIQLRADYDSTQENKWAASYQSARSKKLMLSCERYVSAYIHEHPCRYYFFNRIKLIRQFIFPGRLDDLPFPKYADMQLYHKLIKGGYYILLLLVVGLGLGGIVWSFRNKILFGIFPLVIIITLAGIIGYIEQRYLAPAYPFLCIFSAYLVGNLYLIVCRKEEHPRIKTE